MIGNLNNLFDLFEEKEVFEGHAMAAKAHAKIRGNIVEVLIDSGALFNRMIVDLAKKLGIKELKTVECPAITLPDGHKISPVGAITVGVRFARHLEDVKLLVINGLSQDYILGEDGQRHLKVRVDWEQNLIRFHGKPVPMERSLPEASTQLGCLTVEDAFQKKLKRMQSTQLREVQYESIEKKMKSMRMLF